MKESHKLLYILIFTIFLSLMVTACSIDYTNEHPISTKSPEATEEATEFPTDSPVATENSPETYTEVPTEAPTSIPTGTPTPTPTEAPTPTAIPSFVSEEDDLLKDPHKAPMLTNDLGLVKDLIFSEVISKNTKYSPVNGEYYDIIEVYNGSNEDLNLKNYYISDSKTELSKFNLPNITLKKGEYYLIYCSGNECKENEANFKISSDGEKLFLSKNNEVIDRVNVPSDLKQDYSYARYGETWVYAVTPTLLADNSNGHLTRLSSPKSSVTSGVYNKEIEVNLSSDGVVKYTLDGTKPNENSPIFNGTIKISKTTSIRCYSVRNGEVSDEISFTYIISDGHSLPIVNISMPTDDFTKISKNVKEDYESEALFTLIEDGVEKFSIACGFKLHGNDSRNGRKQNFTLKFRSKYGASKLNYKVFDTLDIDEFKGLLLKGGSEDFPNAIIRDVLCDDIAGNSEHLYTQAVKPVVLYISGEYWGIYFITEKLDEDYIASHLGVSNKNMDIIKAWYENEAGSYNDYYNLVNYCKKHNLNVEEYYNHVAELCDIDSYMDWFIFRCFFADYDNANWRAFKTKEGDNKFHLMFFDMDWAMWKGVDVDTFKWYMEEDDDDVMAALVKSKIFQKKMIARIDELSKSFLSSEYITDRIYYYVKLIESEIPNDQERWKLDIDNWYSQIEVLKKFVKDGNRMKYFREDVINYFKKINQEISETLVS